jgi:hypothetical protein
MENPRPSGTQFVPLAEVRPYTIRPTPSHRIIAVETNASKNIVETALRMNHRSTRDGAGPVL